MTKQVVLGLALAAAMLVASTTPAAAVDLASAHTNYQNVCAKCHGAGGKGDGPAGVTLATRPRNFNDCARMGAISDDTLFKVVKEGGAANGLSDGMPAWGEAFEDDEIHDLIAFVRAFCKR